MKKAFLIILCVLAVACAKRPAPGPEDMTGEALAARWQSMTEMAGVSGPYRDKLSLRFGSEGDTRRVTALLWGNNDSVMRLDVMAGVGALIAKIRDDGSNFLVFAPRENKAYFHQGDTKPLLKIGVPVPFDLAALAGIINGHYGAVFGDKYHDAAMGGNGDAEYELSGRLAGRLSLNEQGVPVAWRQKQGGWTLALAYDEDAPRLPHSIRLSNDNGQKAIILIKERETPQAPFTDEQMRLAYPDATPLLPLSKFRSVRQYGE